MWFWWFVILPLAAVASGLVFAVEQSHRAGHRYAPRHLAPLVVGEDDWRFGSMSLVDEPVLHHLVEGWPRCSVDEAGGPYEGPPGWREQTMADLSPETLDPGPGVVPSHERPPGPVPSFPEDDAIERACEADRLAVAIEMGWLPPGNYERREPPTRSDLGPRAAAVLERYERRRQERWALA